MLRFLLFLIVIAAITFAILYFGGALPFSPKEAAGNPAVNAGAQDRPDRIDAPLISKHDGSTKGPWKGDSDRTHGWDHVFVKNATLLPIEERELSSRLEEVGYITEVLTAEDRWVNRGDVVVRFFDAVMKAAEEQAEAKAKSTASIETGEKKFLATREIYEQDIRGIKAVSQSDMIAHRFQMLSAEQEWIKAKEDQEIAKLDLKRLHEQLKLYDIKSDIDGVVTKILKKKGESVQRGEVVLKVANYERLKIEGTAHVEQVRPLRVGMRVLVEPENPIECRTLRGHKDTVTAVVITPDNRLVVSAGKDGNVILWRGVVPLKVLRDADVTYEVYSLATCASTSDDAKKSTTYQFLTGGSDGRGRLWSVTLDADNKAQASFKDLPDKDFQHRGGIRSVALSADGKFAATGGDDRQIAIWRLDGDEVKFLYTVRETRNARDTAHRGVVTTLVFNPDGTLISAATDKTIRKWELGEDYARLVTTESGRTNDVATLGVSQDGQRVLFDFGEELRIYDLNTGTIVGSLESQDQGAFNGVALFSPKEDMILTFGTNGRLQLWKAPAPPFFRQAAAEGFRRSTPFAFGTLGGVLAPHGGLLSIGWAATAASQKHVAHAKINGANTVPGQTAIPQLWPLNGYEVRHLVTPESSAVRCGAFDSTGRMLVTGGDDRIVRIWALPSADELYDPLEAVITGVGEQIESGTNLVRIKAEMDNPRDPARRLLPGVRVNLSFFPESAR